MKYASPRKDVREEAALMEVLGFRYLGLDSAGHLCFQHEAVGHLKMASTPSARHWRNSHRRAVGKLLGLNEWQLARRIAGQSIRRNPNSRKKDSERRSRLRSARVFKLEAANNRPPERLPNGTIIDTPAAAWAAADATSDVTERERLNALGFQLRHDYLQREHNEKAA